MTFSVRPLTPSISNQPVEHLVITVLVGAAEGEDSFSHDYAVNLAAPHCQRNLPNQTAMRSPTQARSALQVSHILLQGHVWPLLGLPSVFRRPVSETLQIPVRISASTDYTLFEISVLSF